VIVLVEVFVAENLNMHNRLYSNSDNARPRIFTNSIPLASNPTPSAILLDLTLARKSRVKGQISRISIPSNSNICGFPQKYGSKPLARVMRLQNIIG